MPKIIVTSRYIAPSVPKSHLEYYTKYIATRPGVVINNSNSAGIEPQKPSHPNNPVSEKQKQMIDQLLQDFKDTKELFEYEDYINNPTQGTASELISAVIDRNADIVIGKSAYTHYLGERPGVVKDGEHGLFSWDGQSVDLNQVAQEVATHLGNVWTHVVSLRRSDAELSGYAYNDEQVTADAWRSLVRRHILTIAEQTKIKPENLQWYAAFHNKETNPHVHIMMYSKDPKEGYLTNNGIEKIRSAFANDIYSEELSMLNEHQTELRNQLRSSAAMAFDKIAAQLRAGTLPGQQKLYDNITKLKNILDSTKGKKVYKFLKPEAKAVVDSITQQICRNKDIQSLYEQWCNCQKDRIGIYTSKIPDFPSLEDNPEFKTIKNHIIRAVTEMSDIIETQSVKIHTEDPAFENIPLPEEPSETQNNYDHYENQEIPLPNEPPETQNNYDHYENEEIPLPKEPPETQNSYDHCENEEIPLPDEPPIVQKNDENIQKAINKQASDTEEDLEEEAAPTIDPAVGGIAISLFGQLTRMMTQDSNIDQSQFINHSVEAEILRKVLEKKLTQGQKIE